MLDAAIAELHGGQTEAASWHVSRYQFLQDNQFRYQGLQISRRPLLPRQATPALFLKTQMMGCRRSLQQLVQLRIDFQHDSGHPLPPCPRLARTDGRAPFLEPAPEPSAAL